MTHILLVCYACLSICGPETILLVLSPIPEILVFYEGGDISHNLLCKYTPHEGRMEGRKEGSYTEVKLS